MYLQKIDLKKKYALVTGAGKGLGRACAIALAEAGATIIALSRTQSDLDKLEKEIKKIKGKVIKVNCDVMDYKELKINLDKMIDTTPISELNHYIWWLKGNDRTSYVLRKNGKVLLYIWHQLKKVDNEDVIVSGWFIANASCSALDAMHAVTEHSKTIDKHNGLWYDIWNELTIPHSKGHAFRTMAHVGHKVASTSTSRVTSEHGQLVQIPLNFWFCRNPGLALPLIALQYHEVKLKFTWGTDVNCGGGQSSSQVWADYIYLDTDERRRFAQVSHEYLIEQLQYQNEGSANSKYKLNFNHPCKELIWVTQLDGSVNTSSTRPKAGTSDIHGKALVNGAQWFNYTDRVDSTPYAQNDALVLNDILDGVINTSPQNTDGPVYNMTNSLSSAADSRIGRGTKFPEQFGHTLS